MNPWECRSLWFSVKFCVYTKSKGSQAESRWVESRREICNSSSSHSISSAGGNQWNQGRRRTEPNSLLLTQVKVLSESVRLLLLQNRVSGILQSFIIKTLNLSFHKMKKSRLFCFASFPSKKMSVSLVQSKTFSPAALQRISQTPNAIKQLTLYHL